MTYSDLYRCSGCSATFANPAAWRQAVEPTTRHPSASRASPFGIGPSIDAGPVLPLLASWGGSSAVIAVPNAYGYNEADTTAIKEAAATANRAKGQKW
ncbi:hypothetical protein RFUL19S_04241 [Rhizobacter fulvus]